MKLYAYIAAALALLGAALYVNRLHAKAMRVEAAEAAVAQSRADYKALQATHARQLKIATEVSNAYQSDLRRLESERDKPLSVRVCKPARSVPAASRAASGPSPTGQTDDGGTPAPDIGPEIGDQLLNFALDCEANALQLDRLIQWTRSR